MAQNFFLTVCGSGQHLTVLHALVLSCLVLSCHVLSCLVMACLFLSCLVMSAAALSCHVCCLVLSYLSLFFSSYAARRTTTAGHDHRPRQTSTAALRFVLSCRLFACLVLSCLVLPCIVIVLSCHCDGLVLSL